MADYQVKRIPEEDVRSGVRSSTVGTTGAYMNSRRMLGDEGAGVVGKGEWFRSNGLWKTFFLYPVDKLAATSIAGASVEIHGAMELPEAEDDAAFFVIGTLSPGVNQSLSTEFPWRWVRAEVKAPAGVPVQVAMHEQGA